MTDFTEILLQIEAGEAHAKPRDLLRAEGLEGQVGYFGRHLSIAQAIAEFQESGHSMRESKP